MKSPPITFSLSLSTHFYSKPFNLVSSWIVLYLLYQQNCSITDNETIRFFLPFPESGLLSPLIKSEFGCTLLYINACSQVKYLL